MNGRTTAEIVADLMEWYDAQDDAEFDDIPIHREAADRLAELDAKCDALTDEVFNLRMILVAEGITP